MPIVYLCVRNASHISIGTFGTTDERCLYIIYLYTVVRTYTQYAYNMYCISTHDVIIVLISQGSEIYTYNGNNNK